MNRRYRQLLFPFIVLLFGVVSYLNSFSGTFLMDDNRSIVNSQTIDEAGRYISNSSRPLVALSFHLNYLLSGTNAADYHVVNLLIHLGAALLLYGIVRRTLDAMPCTISDEFFRDVAALFSAILWAVHPLQTESVTYIVQRAESMMGFFYLLTLYSFIRGIFSKGRWGWFAVSVAACALGMASKPVMVTAPLVLLLYDRTLVAGSLRKAVRLRRGTYLGLAATWIVLACLVLRPNESSATTGLAVRGITPLSYLATQQGVIVHYLKLIVWPRDLCLDYAWPPALSSRNVLPYAILVLILVIAAVVLCARRYPAGFCIAGFLITLAPTSSFVPIADYAAEHRLYLPLAGVAPLFVGMTVVAAQRLINRFKWRRLITGLLWVFLLLIAVAFSLRTRVRNSDYSSFMRMARDVVRVSPHNFRARVMLIDAMISSFNFQEAEKESISLIADIEKAAAAGDRWTKVSAFDPAFYLREANNMAGLALLCQGRNEASLRFFMRAIELYPNFERARQSVAVALVGLGRYEEGLQESLIAIGLSPESCNAHLLTGLIYVKSGRYSKAAEFLDRALALDSGNMIAKLELAWLLATAPDAALRDGSRAVSLAVEVCRATGGGNHRALDVAAAAFAENGDFERAERAAVRALTLAERANEAGTVDGVNSTVASVHSTPVNIRKRLNSYRNRKPWRQSPEPAGAAKAKMEPAAGE